MKLSDTLASLHFGDFIRKLQSTPPRPDVRLSKLAAARVIDRDLAKSFDASKPEFAQGLLLGLDVPMRLSVLNDNEPYVFVSQFKVIKVFEESVRRPEAFRAVDDTQFRPTNTEQENMQESERVSRRLQLFIKEVRRKPEELLEEVPGFAYKVDDRGAPKPKTEVAPALNVLQYALYERNPIIAGIIAAELATMARSPNHGEGATKMLRRCVAVAIEIEDGPYASMLMMALAAAQPLVWLQQRIRAACESNNPVAVTLLYFQRFAGEQLGLESKAWEAHWLHHDPSMRDFVHTCTTDVLLYAAGWSMHTACDVEPIHRNHFMHGTMVLTELETRIVQAERLPVSPRPEARARRAAAIAQATQMMEFMRLPPSQCDLREKISLLNTCIDEMKLAWSQI